MISTPIHIYHNTIFIRLLKNISTNCSILICYVKLLNSKFSFTMPRNVPRVRIVGNFSLFHYPPLNNITKIKFSRQTTKPRCNLNACYVQLPFSTSRIIQISKLLFYYHSTRLLLIRCI